MFRRRLMAAMRVLAILGLAPLGAAAWPPAIDSVQADGPAEVVLVSQPSFTAPGAVIPIQVAITGTARVDNLYVQYDLGPAPWSGSSRYRTADARGQAGPNLLQWAAPNPQTPADAVWYRVIAVAGRSTLRAPAEQAIPFGRRLDAGSAKASPDWEPDQPWQPMSYGYEGPSGIITTTEPVQGTAGPAEDALYRTQRVSVGGRPFHYRFYYGPGIYQARLQIELRFAELEAAAPGERVFDVLANGEPLVTGLDIIRAAAGARRAHIVSREIAVTYRLGSEPVLDIAFVPRTGEAAVAGVAVRALSAIPQYSAAVQVAGWPDDAHAMLNAAGNGNREPFVRLGRYSDGFEYAAGLLFRRLPVPQGALVSSAWLELWSYPAVGWQYGAADVSIFAQAADSAPDFNSNQPRVTARPLTERQVRWLIDRPWPANQGVASVNLAAPVQEVIDRPRWRPGNCLAIVIVPNTGRVGWRDAIAWDWPDDSGHPTGSRAATLHVTYVPAEFRP